MEELQQRYAELGEAAQRFLEGLLAAQAYGKHQARKVLSLLALYHRRDVLAAMERATRYRAFSFSSLERILAVRAKPKRLPPSLADSYRSPFVDDDPIHPRPTTEYQPLLFGKNTDDQRQNDDDPADDEAPGEEEGTGEEGDAGAA